MAAKTKERAHTEISAEHAEEKAKDAVAVEAEGELLQVEDQSEDAEEAIELEEPQVHDAERVELG